MIHKHSTSKLVFSYQFCWTRNLQKYFYVTIILPFDDRVAYQSFDIVERIGTKINHFEINKKKTTTRN